MGCEQPPSGEQNVQTTEPPAAQPTAQAPEVSQERSRPSGLTDMVAAKPMPPKPRLQILYSAETGGEYSPCPT